MEFTNPDRKPLSVIIDELTEKNIKIAIIVEPVTEGNHRIAAMKSMDNFMVIDIACLIEADQRMILGTKKGDTVQLNERAPMPQFGDGSMEELMNNIIRDADLRKETHIDIQIEKSNCNFAGHEKFQYKTHKGFKKIFKPNHRP